MLCTGAYQLATLPSSQPLVYFAVPMMWGLYNAIPYYLFFHYLYDTGFSLRMMCTILHWLQARTQPALVLAVLYCPVKSAICQGLAAT